MKNSGAPVVATWLLEQFGTGPRVDALQGDLTEQYRQGRSRAWYWRQVLIAIIVGLWAEITTHKLLACRAFVMCWGVLFLEIQLLRYVISMLEPNSVSIYNLFAAYDHRDWWMSYMGVYRSLFWLALPAQFIAAAFSGWVTARLHRPHERALILGFLVSWCAIVLPVTFFLLVTDGPYQARGLAIAATLNILSITGVVAGGLYFAKPRRELPI